MYDVTNKESFETVEKQIRNFLTINTTQNNKLVPAQAKAKKIDQKEDFPINKYHQTEYHQLDESLSDGSHTFKNVILVGTKADLCNDKAGRSKNKRKVSYH